MRIASLGTVAAPLLQLAPFRAHLEVSRWHTAPLVSKTPPIAVRRRSRPWALTARLQDEEEDDAQLAEGKEEDADASRARAVRTRLRNSSALFRRSSWLAWWAQVITSTVSGVILLFANSITERQLRINVVGNGLLLAAVGISLSAVSVFWTYGYIVQARGWASRRRRVVQPDAARKAIVRALRIGAWINLVGMLVTLLGAEQIVGTLVAKVLYNQGLQPFAGSVAAGSQAAAQLSASQFRALDVFIVQANTNTLIAHFAGLCNSLFLRGKADDIVEPAVLS